MKYFVFDTETTGLPVRGSKGTPPVPADDPRQPRLASFAGIICDEEGNAIERHRWLVRPDGWTMAEFDARAVADGKLPASSINGLTDDVLNAGGVSVSGILDFYEAQIAAGLIFVAFNAQFDTKIMRGELRRAGRRDHFDNTASICVMNAMDAYAGDGLACMRGFVKLQVCRKFFDIPSAGDAHEAMADAEDARWLLARLIADKRLPAPRRCGQ